MTNKRQKVEPQDQGEIVDGDPQADEAPGRDPYCPPDEILLTGQLAYSVPVPARLDEEQIFRLQEEALRLYLSLQPRDGAESMLARLAVASTNAAMENFRRANVPGITVSGRDIYSKLAFQAGKLTVDVLKMLDARRSRGRQTVPVSHVTVETGGQAIIGHVHSAPRQDASGVDPGQQGDPVQQGDPGPGGAPPAGETIDGAPQAKPKR